MNREEGIAEIDAALWQEDEHGVLNLWVTDQDGAPIHVFLSLRPRYCDRGHMQISIDGNLHLDDADNFPRYFFSFEEADLHTRTFLKWRLWQHRTYPHMLDRSPTSNVCKLVEGGPPCPLKSETA